MQQLVLAHDDWVLVSAVATLVCLSKGPFASSDDVVRCIGEVLQLVAAMPTSLVPEHVDHSVDDLAARIGRISSIDEGLALLLQLSDPDASGWHVRIPRSLTSPTSALRRSDGADAVPSPRAADAAQAMFVR